ncbi:hypothetical protein EGW08_000435 [Elysia chlorotica]|uniref:SUEL-type lectin domain-containing protein n=1 Tax=Elysia chlorotica TaxID=188477 RepID=A0A3S1AH10_ELYCH|nr:hypothetical protein EGW08_000435 [Elysia chlorotica]
MYCALLLPELPIQTVDICRDEAHFRCGDGELISVVDVRCEPGGGACANSTQTSISGVCSEQQTCSNSALTSLLAPGDCDTPVHVGFQCKKGRASLCQTNICSGSSSGLVCPSGHVIHVRHMTCLASQTEAEWAECPRSSYDTLFMCEGARHCDASGLRALLPQLCNATGEDGAGQAVLVKYFCIPESQVDTSCSTGRFHRLKGPFGVIRPPRLDSDSTDISFREEEKAEDDFLDSEDDLNTSLKPITDKSSRKKNKKGSASRCRWLINPRNDVIEIRVHQLTSTIPGSSVASVGATASFSSSSHCPDLGLVWIRYKNCSTGAQAVLVLCEKDGVLTSGGNFHQSPPLHVQSCGMVQITSALPLENGDQAAVDKLIISYHKISASPEQALPPGLGQCLAPPAPRPPGEDNRHTTAESYDWRGATGSDYDPAAPSSIYKKFGHSDEEDEDQPKASSRFPKLRHGSETICVGTNELRPTFKFSAEHKL